MHASQFFLPYVSETTHRGERRNDVYSRLLEDRIIYLGYPIVDDVANAVIAQLLFLESQDNEKDVFLYINSPGGDVMSALAIYDTMHYLRAPVATICAGQANGVAALLLAGGALGKRRILPHSRVSLQQHAERGFQGQASDIEIRVNEAVRLRDTVHDILVRHTGQTLDTVRKDTERERFLTASDAVTYGLCDEVIDGRFGENTASKRG
jgi:ATP-dependent Clp protease protease subunit